MVGNFNLLVLHIISEKLRNLLDTCRVWQSRSCGMDFAFASPTDRPTTESDLMPTGAGKVSDPRRKTEVARFLHFTLRLLC